jgi:hypothetical protein
VQYRKVCSSPFILFFILYISGVAEWIMSLKT